MEYLFGRERRRRSTVSDFTLLVCAGAERSPITDDDAGISGPCHHTNGVGNTGHRRWVVSVTLRTTAELRVGIFAPAVHLSCVFEGAAVLFSDGNTLNAVDANYLIHSADIWQRFDGQIGVQASISSAKFARRQIGFPAPAMDVSFFGGGAIVVCISADIDGVAHAFDARRSRTFIEFFGTLPTSEFSEGIGAPAFDAARLQTCTARCGPRGHLYSAREARDTLWAGVHSAAAFAELSVVVFTPAVDLAVARYRAGMLVSCRYLNDVRQMLHGDGLKTILLTSVAELSMHVVSPARDMSAGFECAGKAAVCTNAHDVAKVIERTCGHEALHTFFADAKFAESTIAPAVDVAFCESADEVFPDGDFLNAFPRFWRSVHIGRADFLTRAFEGRFAVDRRRCVFGCFFSTAGDEHRPDKRKRNKEDSTVTEFRHRGVDSNGGGNFARATVRSAGERRSEARAQSAILRTT